MKETNVEIEISHIIEDCPNCGASLATSLRRQTKKLVTNDPPKFQTAYELTRFRLDIDKLEKLVTLSTTGSLCIVGYKANLLLTRLSVRALLPASYGGLNSPHVVAIDAGNKSDFYQTSNFVRQYGLDLKSTLDRVIVSRPFTIHQLQSLVQRELPKAVQKYQTRIVIVPGLLDLFDDPNIKKKEARRVIQRIMQSLKSMSNKLLVIASMQKSPYESAVLPTFESRIALSVGERGRVKASVYESAKVAKVVITERELRLVTKQ